MESLSLAWFKTNVLLNLSMENPHMPDILGVILCRSEPAPLHIFLYGAATVLEWRTPSLVQDLFGAASCWLEIRVSLSISSPWIELFCSIKNDFPHLHCIDLRHNSFLVNGEQFTSPPS
jgi:hypothetical protein